MFAKFVAKYKIQSIKVLESEMIVFKSLSLL